MDTSDESIDARTRELLAKHVGKEVLEFVGQHPMPSQLLASADAKVRFAVLVQAVRNRKVTQQLADDCEALSHKDTDAYVRGIALTCLSSFYSKTNNARIGALFATVVCDMNERTDVRRVAYSALSQMSEEIDLSHSPVAPGFSFPADIDWTWVKSFMEDDKG